jgi:serine/threonine protein phosphatase PrpC
MKLDSKTAHEDALSFDVATVAFRGARQNQEDSVVSSFPLGQETGFSVLADGMGGHLFGSLASSLVMSEVFTQLKMKEAMLDEGVLNIPATLREVAEAANKKISDHIKFDDETYGMGSTLLTTVIWRDKLYWISIGDSPLLLFRDGALRQLNKDHSMAPQIDMMIKTGAMTTEAGRNHPDRNTLTSALSGEEIEIIDCPARPIALLPDDIVIAASDGLQFLSNSMIAKTLKVARHGHGVDIANALLAALRTLDNPEQDNTTIVVLKLNEGVHDTDALDADDIPVLATADDEEGDDATPQVVGASEKEPALEATATADEAPPERKAYWYRGQKYYKD